MFPIILIILLVAGVVVFAIYIRRNPFDELPRKEKPGDCNEQCGTCFDVCSASKVLQTEMAENVDFDDSELDAFVGTKAEDYSDSQIEMFASILETLTQDETGKWIESLRRRNIELPAALRDEAIMIMNGE